MKFWLFWLLWGYAALVAKITPSGTVTEYPTASGGAPRLTRPP